ncbi:MAG: LemA family protein [Gemmobacter sp.]
MEVELKRRADLLPNLAAVVKAARMHDKDTQQVIAILRAQA